MPAAHRHTDVCTGHGCWPSRNNIEGSPDVFINDLAAHRVGDAWASHCCCSIPESHGSAQASGSPTVYVNDRPLARVGDSVACGSRNLTGSPDVFCDD